MDRVAAVDGVVTIDFKGQYGLEVGDDAALLAMYQRTLATFTTAVFEDPHDHPAVLEMLAPVAERVSYDAPIMSVPMPPTTPHRTAASAAGDPRGPRRCDEGHKRRRARRMSGPS